MNSRTASWLWNVCLFAYCGLIYWLSDQPRLPAPDLFGNEDKLIHAAAFALMAWLFWQGWRRLLAGHFLLLALLAVLFCTLFGLTDEWHQSFVPGRDASIYDWLADTVGAILMVVVMLRKRSAGPV